MRPPLQHLGEPRLKATERLHRARNHLSPWRRLRPVFVKDRAEVAPAHVIPVDASPEEHPAVHC